MILNVLQVSRVEEGKLVTYVEDVDLARVASESVVAFKLAAEAVGAPIRVESGGRSGTAFIVDFP